MIAIIGGTTYSIKTNTFQSEDTIEMRATCSFSIVDKLNEYSFHKGQPVRIEDDKNNNELVFAGYLETSDKYPLASRQANVYMHDIVCIDMHYLADKRRISYAARNKLAGDIIKDIVDQKLVEEGVYYSKDLNFVETTTDDFSTGELSNVIAENDSVRLDKVGSDVTDIDNDNSSFSEGTLTDVVAVNDGLELKEIPAKNLYGSLGNCNDLKYWDSSQIELYSSDWLFEGGSLRVHQPADSGHLQIRSFSEYSQMFYSDRYYFSTVYMKNFHPDSVIEVQLREDGKEYYTDRLHKATGTSWKRHFKKFTVSKDYLARIQLGAIYPPSLVDGLYDGLQIIEITEGEFNDMTEEELAEKYPFSDGDKTRYYKSGTRQPPQLDLSAVNDVASSSISWTEALNSQTIAIETSVDGGSTWQMATNGDPIPNLPADPTTLDVRQTLSTTDTTVTPVLNSIEVSIESAYETTGYRISEPFDLSPAVEDGGSTISWQEIAPTNTSITVETSLDDGVTWDVATNGQPIPNLPTDLTDVQLKYKSTLNTTDGSVTPTFDEANISVLNDNPSIEDGVEILETRANFVPTEQLISSVADKMNYWWKIDSNKMIHFKSRESEPAEWELEPEYIRGMPTTKVGNPLYRNQQLVKGPVGITEEQVDIERGDGEKRAFPLSFNVAEEPTIEISINGGAWQSQTVGRKGVDDNFQWYWEKESDVVSQDDSETRLTSNDRVRVTFIGQFKIVAQTYDPNLIVQQKNIDGTSGIVEDAITVGNVEGREAAIEIGNSKIKKYGVDSKRLKFQTRRSGLKAGQLITVRNLDAMDIADGEKLLITKTSIFDESGQIFYDISAVKGPKHRTWEEFFMELTKRAELVISEGIGESEILIIPIDFSKTWTQAENPNIFRKLKADGTWLADGTYTPNFEDDDRVTHIAWFNGNTELGRQEYTQQDVNTADRVNTLTYLGPNSANDDITHFGWIGGFRATEEVGTGVLIDKVAYDLIKEETEALQISRSDFSWNY